MTRPTRRSTLAGLVSLSALAALPATAQSSSPKVVVIGGGFGGAMAARTVKSLLPAADVTMVELHSRYIACPFSNLVIAGLRDLSLQTFSYDGVTSAGVTHAMDNAVSIDPDKQTVLLAGGTTLAYDRLILSPGIDLKFDAIDGYDAVAAEMMPHAWKAGDQTLMLRRQLEQMEDGGTVVISAPPAPYRCPPGPYERASLIAHYLKTHKPASKLLVLDSKDAFSKKPLFQAAWNELYGDLVEWRGVSDDGRVTRVDAAAGTVHTDFEDIDVAVANIIPPQQAASIARHCGAADATGWCPVDAVTFESTLLPKVHVIGDASIAAPMPKSAFAANIQAKTCALQVARLLADQEPVPSTLANTCYSYVSPDTAISVSGVYRTGTGSFASVPGSGGVSPSGPAPDVRSREAAQAASWFGAITGETFS